MTINYRALTGPPKTITAECWPLAADSTGAYLISHSRDAWRLGPVPATGTVRGAVQHLLMENAARPAVIHQSSSRDEGHTVVETWFAVVDLDGAAYVADDWPRAIPLTVEGMAELGQPIAVGPLDEPIMRMGDILMHAVRHLAQLALGDRETGMGVDAAVRAAITPEWLAACWGVRSGRSIGASRRRCAVPPWRWRRGGFGGGRCRPRR